MPCQASSELEDEPQPETHGKAHHTPAACAAEAPRMPNGPDEMEVRGGQHACAHAPGGNCLDAVLGSVYLQGQLRMLPFGSECPLVESVHRATAEQETSVLLLGDSADDASVELFCRSAGVPLMNKAQSAVAPRGAPGRSISYCKSRGIQVAVDIHVGITGPPYWTAMHHTVSRNAKNVTLEALPRQALLARQVFGGKPAVVIAHSYAWDYSAWWQHRGGYTRESSAWFDASFVDEWALQLGVYLHALKSSFPTSLLLWRTAPVPRRHLHDGVWWRAPGDGMDAMNQAARRVCAGLCVPVLDMANSFPAWETFDGIHPRPASGVRSFGRRYNESRVEGSQNEALWQQILSAARVASCSSHASRRLRSCLINLGGGVAQAPRPQHLFTGGCGVTKTDTRCRGSSHGSWQLSSKQARTVNSALIACQELCQHCMPCRYISVSSRHADCSWYASCELANLDHTIPGFLSAERREKRS